MGHQVPRGAAMKNVANRPENKKKARFVRASFQCNANASIDTPARAICPVRSLEAHAICVVPSV